MFDIKENLKKLPDTPGVYMHKDKLGQVIYVGKAISLRNRVRQYFQSYGKSTAKLRALTANIAEFDYITCATEMEALILECNLIKKYMPKYNVLLRDDKTYPYIVVTLSEKYPRVMKTRIIKKDGNKYFGPYSDVGAVNLMIELLNNVYGLKRCSAQDFPPGFRPCLNYHIEQCKGICTGNISEAEYRKSIDDVLEFLSGKKSKLVESLRQKMEEASEELRFEDAARYRDAIAAAEELSETQRVTMAGDNDMDIVLPVKDIENAFIVLFTVRNGKLVGRESFQVQEGISENRREMTAEFIKQYYSRWAEVPHDIIVEELPEESVLIEEFLSQGKTISEKNRSKAEKQLQLRKEIKAALLEGNIDIEPRGESYRIESYDISNTNGIDSVGAMVVFEGTNKIRKDYRRFKIKTIEGPDDYGSLQEMIYRRFSRAQKGDPAFAILPDCIFMDGGRGQVTAAKKVLDALRLDVPVVGLVKDDSHRTRGIMFEDGREISLKDRPLLFAYAGTIQEEVHRFAIEYHRNLRGKKTISSILDEIKGIGPRRRNALLAHFDSIDSIKKASLAELVEVEGMSEESARNVIEFFK